MTAHLLDNPVWTALTTRHASLAEGDGLARRYPPETIPFAGTQDMGPDSLAAVAPLLRPQEEVLIANVQAFKVPPALHAVHHVRVVQMILETPPAPIHDERIERLTEADAAEMLALAQLTRPGPFTLGAQRLGSFHGIRIGGRIAAMAGIRMRQHGFAELSGVCTHPDFRGHGLARTLSTFVMHAFLGAGETPYLHAYETNEPAIGLYASIGFERRAILNIAVVRPVES